MVFVVRSNLGYNRLSPEGKGCRLRSKRWLLELACLLILLILPLSLFWPVALGSKTLLPADNLFQWEPYRAYAADNGVSLPPHNELLSDLVLENLVWKQFTVQSLRERDIPLWNPYLFAGVPFLAAGQHSALYPLSALFYILPLPRAYGLFTVLQLWLAGASMYFFVRVLRLKRFPALVAAITYQLSAFFVVSVVFTMIIAAAAWLPALLAIIEIMVRKQENRGSDAYVPILPVVGGAIALGLQILAGHPEILVYTLMVMAAYALLRLVLLSWRQKAWKPAARLAVWMGFMVGLGVGLGSVQLIPMVELVTRSFREGSVTYQDVVGWSYPSRQAITFLVPDFFGNPAHHGYYDLVSRHWVSVDRIFWGIKNYVEAGSYVGILPLLLALVAIVGSVRRMPGRGIIWIFGGLATVSLLFVFGTPLYAVLYHALPGIKQLHSPFRWVFPYTLSIAVLAGYGVSVLDQRSKPQPRAEPHLPSRIENGITWFALVSGCTLVIGLLIVLIVPSSFVPLADRFLASVEKAQEAFASGQMFLSYQWPLFLTLGLLLLGSGIVLRLSRTSIQAKLPWWPRLRIPLWKPLAAVVVAADLLYFGAGFNPSADPAWLRFTPPSIEFLREQAEGAEPWRLTTYRPAGSTKTLNPNIPWSQGLQDVRGYDSIIPAQYVGYMRSIEGQGELLYNQIAAIYGAENLSSPLLDLLTVRFVVTEGEIPNLDYELVYEGEVRIYENVDVLPRAFALPRAEIVSPEDLPTRLHSFDPRQSILLEQGALAAVESRPTADPWPLQPATVVTYSSNVVFVDVEMPGPGWLVLADSYFPGWKAYRSAPDVRIPGPKDEPAGETEIQIVRADGNFRAVWLDEGAHRVRFKYTPMSFKLGLYGSFLAAVVLFLLLLLWFWRRFYRESEDDPTVKRVAKNSLLPMGLQLLNRLVDFAFAMLMLRILAPQMTGRFDFAVGFIGYFEILARFGLGTLLTRETAKDRMQANRLLTSTTVLRGLLWLASLPLMVLVMLVYAQAGGLTPDIVAAVACFALGMFFSNLADGFSAVFYAYEKMEYPAAIATVTALTRVSLGVLALLVGWGIVGLAAVSIVAGIVSAITLGVLMVRHCLKPHLEWDAATSKWMMRTSFPLMINHFLATAFFRIDVLLLKPMKGDAAVGYYGAAYRYVNGLNIIPAFFTQAIFPLMSRYADSARASLMRAYTLSLRLLLIVAVPIAAGTPFIARELILVLGGSEFLPDSSIALQLVIWFLPFSFVNSVTQYVLIAIDQQRFLTRAFLIGVTFNIVANLIVIPYYSYKGAAVVTVLSEVVLLLPFYYSVRKHLGPLPWLSVCWRPVAASSVMAGVMWALTGVPGLPRISWLLLLPIGATVYLGSLILVGGLRQPDMDLLRGLLPRRGQVRLRRTRV